MPLLLHLQKRDKINYGTVWQSLPCSAAKCDVGQISFYTFLTFSAPVVTVEMPPLRATTTFDF